MRSKKALTPGLRAPRLVPSVRLGFYAAGTLTTTIWVSCYTTLNFAWVCMINDTALHLNASGYDGSLAWGKEEQKVAFSAYNLGGVLSVILPGYLIDRFGARAVGAIAMAASALSTAALPLLSDVSYWALSAARVITGFGGAFAWPLVYALTSHWAPKPELGRALLVAATGFPLGQFAAIGLDGIECSRLGWPWVYYISAVAILLWAAAWGFFYRNDPAECAWVSKEERDWIQLNRDRKSSKQKVVPWKAIFTATPVFACMISYLAQWQFIFCVSAFGPTYLKEVLRVPVESNGILSAIPLLGFVVGRWAGGFISDLPFRSYTFRTKLCNSVFAFGGAGAMLGLSFVREESPVWLATSLLTATLTCGGFSTGGYQKSVVLLAPQYSGLISSIINVVGSSGAMLMPYLIAALTPHRTAVEWSHVFYYLAGCGALAGTVFLLLGSGELQEWAKPIPQSFAEMGFRNMSEARDLELKGDAKTPPSK